MSNASLYIVSTPIGNLRDITLRAMDVLEEVDEWVVEDTRRSGKLREKLDLPKKPMTSYYDEVEQLRIDELIGKLQSGTSLALLSDAGTPLKSDPGHYLVEACWEDDIPVKPVPGVSASDTALAVSAFPMEQVLELGFFPKKTKAKRDTLLEIQYFPGTVVFFDSPERVLDSLKMIRRFLGDRPVLVGREMTKKHETFHRGAVSDIIDHFESTEPQGEFTVLVHPVDEPDVEPEEYMAELLEKGVQLKDAAKAAARFSEYAKSDLYQKGLELQNE
jgi:16S rRNA (cytidine1402-2'-O)-methyltransferase